MPTSKIAARGLPSARSRRARRAPAVCATALCLALAAFAGPVVAPASAAAPGVVIANTGSPHAGDLRALGTHWVRIFASWPDLEPQPGALNSNWLYYYSRFFHALPAGTKVIVDVVNTPQWETGSSDPHTPPVNPEDYAAFVGALAHQWAGEVAAYEIWNEEDSPSWWVGAPNPAAYAALLKATYPFVKGGDPGATVVLGGLTGNDYSFLEGVYAAGAKGSFDAVGVHTDTACNIAPPGSFLRQMDGRIMPDSFLAYREVHAVMLANGDDKPIWMTELSWRTTGATCGEGAWAGQKPEGVSDARQAEYLTQAYHCLAQDSYVQVALWYQLQDEGSIVSGLLRGDGARKPAFAALSDYVHNGDHGGGACGDFSGPRIDVSAPANHTTYSAALPIRVSARDSQGVGRITLEIDGKKIRNFTNQAFPTRLAGGLHWHGAQRIPYGRHRLTFIAIDKLRNETKISLTIYHRRAHRRAAHHRRHH
jgi:hypothetical protein